MKKIVGNSSQTIDISRFQLKLPKRKKVQAASPKDNRLVLTLFEQFTDPKYKNRKWGKLLIDRIRKIKTDFIVRYQSFPDLNMFKSKCIVPFKINDELFLLDDWDYDHPTSIINNDNSFFLNNPFYRDTKVILKLQYNYAAIPLYRSLKRRLGITVLPFSFFPNKDFVFDLYKWKNKDFRYLCCFTGKGWHHRAAYINYMKPRPDIFMSIGDFPLEMNAWIKLVSKTKWGLILKGKGTGFKNRREPEFMSMGIPLAMNYKPVYYFPFEAGTDYVYLSRPQDIQKLITIDPVSFHKRSLHNYKNYFSPAGTSKLLKTIYIDYKRGVYPKHLTKGE